MNTRAAGSSFSLSGSWPRVAATLMLFLFAPGPVRAAETPPLRLDAALLGGDLGDPRDPGNAKLVLTLPEELAHRLGSLAPGDFTVHIHPADLPAEEGMEEAYRAGGIYLWRDGPNVFLDVRNLPLQSRDGPAVVRVRYAPDGPVLAEGTAVGFSRYRADLADVVLVVDISLSMTVNDPGMLRVQAARSFIEMARRGGGIGRVGLVTFNHNARRDLPLLPLERGEELLEALERIGAEGLTNLDLAIDMGMQVLEGSRNPVMVFLTDGKNEGTEYADTHLRAATAGVRIHTVGLSSQADHRLLEEMAAATGGLYFEAVRDSDLPDIYTRLAAELGKRRLLFSRTLPDPEGTLEVPVDATVTRMLVVAGGGARVAAAGPGEGGSVPMNSAQALLPRPGLWTVRWDGAVPEETELSFYGDTPFFLDLFPPQLRGRRLSLAATLAEGDSPLPGAEVWLRPVPGLLFRPVLLREDGRHGGGVYTATVEMEDEPDPDLVLTVQATGAAWDAGEFVRQAAEAAVRQPELPPEFHARLDGLVDFGLLFPGESGAAQVVLDLESPDPRELELDLSWDDDTWPRLASGVVAHPGRRSLELEITVPAEAGPGEYQGLLSVAGDGPALDSVPARVRVGTVRFDPHPGVDLGVIPPGTFGRESLRIGYQADRDVALSVAAEGEDLTAASAWEHLPAGRGEVILDAAASPPIDRDRGDYQGAVLLRAGPGAASVPVRWRVQPYTASAPETKPLPDLPDLPELPGEAQPLRRLTVDGEGGDFTSPIDPGDSPAAGSDDGDSVTPWERTARTLRERPGYPVDPALAGPAAGPGGHFDFPSVEGSGDRSLWNAWWMYLLAALLLLLLLLLLVAYILYRLKQSRLARLLLASALANAVLLGVFILLLSTAAESFSRPPQVVVNLVPEAEEDRVRFSPQEQAALEASLATREPSSRSGAAPHPAESAATDSRQSLTVMELEKRTEMEDGLPGGMELADGGAPAAQPMERERQDRLQRRNRRMERSRDAAEPSHEPELAEMAEPPARTERSEPGDRQIGEARSEGESLANTEPPSWSGAARPLPELRERREELAARAPGMETVRMEPAIRRSDPRGRRRSRETLPEIEPEPRVEMADPLRDPAELAVANPSERTDGLPGIMEIRVEAHRTGEETTGGGKPGVAGDESFSEALIGPAETLPRDPSSGGLARLGGARGGRRGTPARSGALVPSQGDMPGGNGDRAAPAASPSSRTGRGGDVIPGEERFDAGGGAPGASPAATDGTTPHGALAGEGTPSPSPLPGVGGESGRSAFSGDGPAAAGMASAGPSRQGTNQPRQRDGDGPRGTGEMPGGPVLTASSEPGDSSGAGRRRGPAAGGGEGRFDDMESAGGASGLSSRRGPAGGGLLAGTRLGAGAPPGAGASAPLEPDGSDWKLDGRRTRPRSFNVAASSLEMDSLVLVLGDFAGADPAPESLFDALSGLLGQGVSVERRLLTPGDRNLADSLLALITPETAAAWSDGDYSLAAGYVRAGGHIWMDAPDSARAAPFLGRMAELTGGRLESYPRGHTLSEGDPMEAVLVPDAERPGVVATYQNWRPGWRSGRPGDGRALRFLVRSLNLFLSGDAESGIALPPGDLPPGTVVEPAAVAMPERLAGAAGGTAAVWEDFASGTAHGWRMPSWSDPGDISVIPDGQGGRAMKIDLGPSNKGRTAVYRTLTPPADLSRSERMSLEAWYDGAGEASLSLILTVRGVNGWMDYETPAAGLSPGWNRLEFETGRNNFRSLGEGGALVRVLPGREETGRAGFFLYREHDSPAVLLLRDMRIHGE